MRIRMLIRLLRKFRRFAISHFWICLLFATPALSQDVLITGELSDGGIYKLLFSGTPLKTSEKNTLYENIVTTIYHWTDENTEVFLYIKDDHKYQQLDRTDNFIQSSYLSRFLNHYETKYSPAFLNTGFTEFTYQQNTPFELKGLRTEVHELKSDRKGAIYSLYTGTAAYALLILGMSEEEVSPYVESLELAPYPPNDISLQQDLSKKISILLHGTIPYQSPPHPKRTLAPQTGGWDYIHAPPEKAETPGTIPKLDYLWRANLRSILSYFASR